MESTFFILIILIALVADVILHRHLKWLPLPFCFIVTGILLSFLPQYHHYIFDSDFFLFFVVTPLLYIESQSASRYWIGRGAINIFSLAIALVVVTVVAVGFSLHVLYPILPLSLAIALCAIVTPTDASAVSAFMQPNQKFKIPTIILQNESLFNDASGFVAFDIALAAFATGTISLSHATGTFFVEFVGGLVLGTVIGMGFHWLRSKMIRWNDDIPFIMISLELIVPFVVYVCAEKIHVSGILAVVAAGLVQGMETDKLRLVSSQVQLVRNHIWELVSQVLNGFIFMLLGISLPAIMARIVSLRPGLLAFFTLIGVTLYGLKFLLRLVWTRYFVWMHLSSNHRWLDSCLMAVSGASGTISLSLAFLLPQFKRLPGGIDRNALLYIATVVILISLAVAAIIVPKMTKETAAGSGKAEIDWNAKMIHRALKTVRANRQHPAEVDIVISALTQQLHHHDAKNQRLAKKTFDVAHGVERTAVKKLLDTGEITTDQYHMYLEFIELAYNTVHSNFLQRLWLRLRFGSHTLKVYRDFQTWQDALLTSPVVTEQLYWKNQFEEHGWEIKQIESVGFKAAIKALEDYQRTTGRHLNGLHPVIRFYQERHRRMSLPTPDSKLVYQLFLQAFHAEYEFVQQLVADETVSVSKAETLQQQIIYDEMAYLNGGEWFIKR